MKLIIGLGNPAAKYNGTRHNLGFMALDFYAAAKEAAFINKPKFLSHIAEVTLGSEKLLLIKPSTYYNETGRAAQAIKDFYNLKSSDILVVHDDLALPFGTIRTRLSGSDAGNNGIKSLNKHFGMDYARVRIGIFNDVRERMDDADFVLAKLNKDEQGSLGTILKKVALFIDDFATGNFDATSHT